MYPTLARKPVYRKKVKHYNNPGEAHFLTFSCYHRLPLLSKDRTRLWFVEALEKARRKHQFDLWAYHRFWQSGPGRDHNLYEPETIHRAIEYIHMNPVWRGLVARPEDWPWSSARDWAGQAPLYLRVDRTVPPILVIER